MLNSGKIYSQKTPHTNTASPLKDYAAAELFLAAAGFLFTLLHFGGSALLLLATLGVTGEDEVVVIEVGQLAVQEAVTLQLLSRRENAATFGALLET